jgi:hypothetical protein
MDTQALGRYLRQTREANELTLDDAEQVLKIRRAILDSFELGEFNIPNASSVQIRGFIRNYARYLGLDEDRTLAYYDEALTGVNPRKGVSAFGVARKKGKRDSSTTNAANGVPNVPVAPRSITDTHPKLPPVQPNPALTPPRRGVGLFAWILRLLVAGAALAVIAFVVLQLLPIGQASSSDDSDPDSDILAVLPPTQTHTPAVSPTILVLPTSASQASSYSGSGLLLELDVTQRAWMEITADGLNQFTGIARPGQGFAVQAVDNITLMSSNAEALDATFNGQPQPSYGGRGQRVDIVYRADGVQISTGPGFEPSPIASDTPLPTPTDSGGALIAALTPTNTEGPSPTPSNTSTITNTPTNTLTPSQTYTPSDTFTPSPIPSDTPIPTSTLTPSNTFTASAIPSATPLPSATPIPSATPVPLPTNTPSPTAILPPRATSPNATPPKSS